MKRSIAAFIACLCLICPIMTASRAAQQDMTGTYIDDFTVTCLDGSVFSLSEALSDHEIVLISLWATWCPPCEDEFPCLQAAWQDRADDVAVIALSADTEASDDELRAFADRLGVTFPIARDSGVGLAEKLGITSLPTSLIVDRGGTVVDIGVGAKTSAAAFALLFDQYAGGADEGYTHDDPAPVDNRALREAGNAEGSDLRFVCDGGDMPFVPVPVDGRNALQSGNAGQDGTSASVTIRVSGGEDTYLAFDLRLSTEEVFDALYITRDGDLVKVFSGQRDWFTWALPIPDGPHEVTLRYVKDAQGQAGDDAVLIDEARLIDAQAAQSIAADGFTRADDTGLTVLNEGARRLTLAPGAPDALTAALKDTTVWIVPSTEAIISARVAASTDPDAAFFQSFYDDSRALMSACYNEDLEACLFTASLDPGTAEDAAYTYVCLYEDDGSLYRPLGGAMIVTDEAHADALAAYLAEVYGGDVSWIDADA